VLALPNQTPQLIERYGLTREDVDRQVWAIDASGQQFSGAAAINRVWMELGGAWRWIARLYRFALVARLEERAYGWVAAHRRGLSRVWGAEPEWKE
jgi:predicted DCC family thiol-disulfide oxidoreductase YuxK